MARLSATNYDPHQLAEQWKDRVHREEQTLIFKVGGRPLTGSTAPSALDVCDLRLQNLHYNLNAMQKTKTPSASTKTPSAATRSQNGGGSVRTGSFPASVVGSVAGSAASRRSNRLGAAAGEWVVEPPPVAEHGVEGIIAAAEKTSAVKGLQRDLDRERKLRKLAQEEASMLRAMVEERGLPTTT